jgi:hypothetical protein
MNRTGFGRTLSSCNYSLGRAEETRKRMLSGRKISISAGITS